MPLPIPLLDDRRADDLVADLLARIPAHTPEWTDPRVGDPGRTLIELFAFLGDTLLYRANQVPELQRRVFLNLLGMGLKPALMARGMVTLRLPDEAREAVDLRERASIAKPLPFETAQEISIAPVTGEVYLKRRVTADGHPELADTLAQLGALYGGKALDAYQTLPLFADGAVDAGVDVVADSVDGCLWMALLAPKPARGESITALRDRCVQQLARNAAGAARLLNVGLVPALTVPDDQELVGERERIGVSWEISVGGARATDYQTLDPSGSDTTDGLRRAGVVRLLMPGPELIGVGDSARGIDAVSGVDDEPPRLDDPDRAQRLVAWLRMKPAAGVQRLLVSWAGLHAVQIEQGVTTQGLVVAQTSGSPNEVITLPLRNVLPDSLQLEIAEPGMQYAAWTRVDDLALVSHRAELARDARAYELDAESGQVRLGDGMRGRLPPAGSRMRIVSARSGGGRAGNLPAGTLKDIVATSINASGLPGTIVNNLKLSQPIATQGGEDAEDVDAAQQRIPAMLRHRERAVTADDYASLARETPGMDIGRVEVLPRFAPRTRAFGIPGVVAVMVLPGTASGEVGTAPNPRADRPLIEAVHAWLEPRRLLATELNVIGCEYLPLSVSIAIGLRDGAPREETLAAVRLVIRRLLWPLAPGGFDGNGWPLGRTVADRELEVEAARVPGVATVAGVNLFTGGPGAWALAGRDANGLQQVALAPWQLPELMQVLVEVGNAPARSLAPDAASGSGGTRVAVPVIVDLC
ncbi:putative baseplate assembly protein [Roseateles sp. NT4]|uniref:putative baseplate assembly protein n=1 Tax=Roseateles sp. NT4 TaxID=3453715 RepID=UPI003EED6C2B